MCKMCFDKRIEESNEREKKRKELVKRRRRMNSGVMAVMVISRLMWTLRLHPQYNG